MKGVLASWWKKGLVVGVVCMVSVLVLAQAQPRDLSVSVAAPQSATVGTAAAFTVGIGGSSGAAGVTVTAVFLPNVTLDSSVPAGLCTANTAIAELSTTVTCAAAGLSSLVIRMVPQYQGTLTAVVGVIGSDPDPIMANNKASAIVSVTLGATPAPVPTLTGTQTSTRTNTPTATPPSIATNTATPTRTPTPSGPTPTPGSTWNLFGTRTPSVTPSESPKEVGELFKSSQPGAIVALRFWKSPNESGSHRVTVWDTSGVARRFVDFGVTGGSGWQEATLDPPMFISQDEYYWVSYNVNASAGETPDALGGCFFGIGGIVNGPLTTYCGGTGGPFQFPGASLNWTNYFADIVFQPGAVPTPTSTITPAATATATPTFTRSSTPSNTPTATRTVTLTLTPTQTFVPSGTATPTAPATATAMPTSTSTVTPTATNTPTNTPANAPTNTATSTPANSSTNTPTSTRTNTPTITPTVTITKTPTQPSPTRTPTATLTSTGISNPPTNTPSPTRTPITAAITLIQKRTAGNQGVTSVTAGFSLQPAEGNLLVAIVGVKGTNTINTPTDQNGASNGWQAAINQKGVAIPSRPGQAIFYKIAGASEPVTIKEALTGSNTTMAIQLYEYSGIATSDELDGTSSGNGTGSDPASTGAVTTNATEDLLLAAITIDSIDSVTAASNSFSLEQNFVVGSSNGRETFASADRKGSASGNSTTFTHRNNTWRAQIAAFRKAP